jgi:hypothetical protein
MNKGFLKNFNQNTVVKRRCGYILLGIKKNNFLNLGAKPITNTNSYYIEKKYDGTPTGEVCALLGMEKNDLLSLFSYLDKEKKEEEANLEDEEDEKIITCKFDDYNSFKTLYNKEKTILNYLREFQGFRHIDKIEHLNIKYMESAISSFYNNLKNFDDDYLFIFNIEPRGQTKRQLKFYPNPNMCIPGGNMENRDNYSFEKCAIREFEEETGIKISEYKIIQRYNIEVIKKFKNQVKPKESMSFPTSTSFKRFEYENKNIKNEREFFLAKLL